VQLPIFATRFETNVLFTVDKRKVLYRKTLMVRILVVSLPSAFKRSESSSKRWGVQPGDERKEAKEKFG
jgi:hypothetical protein